MIGVLAGLALACGALASGDAAAKTLQVGKGQAYDMPSAAIAAAADGDTVAIEPGEYFDCAVVSHDRLTIVGLGEGATLTDKVCLGKGMLITAGRDITVRNLTLTRARVPDQNGAGIRAEGTNLTVENVRFINDENGILANDNDQSTIRVVASLFDRDGKCARACAHGIYAGHIKLLRVEGSHFTATREGHSIKSRALRTEIVGTHIEDGPDGTASYSVEIPNGGALLMTDDVIEKGPRAENHSAAIVIGAEGITQRTTELVFRNITFTNDLPMDTIFVRNLSATEVDGSAMTFKGQKTNPLEGDGHFR